MRCTIHATLLTVVAIELSAGMAGARPRLGVTVGAQLTELVARSNEFILAQEARWTTTGFGGASLELPLGGGLVLATGLEYGQHADDEAFAAAIPMIGPTTLGESRRQLRQRVLVSPLRLEMRRGHWRFGAGPELRYLVSAEQRWQVAPPQPMVPNLAAAHGRVAGPAAQVFESVRLDQWQDATYLFRRWSLGAQLAVGRELPLGAHAVRADLRWSEGITHQQWAAAEAQRARAAQLSFGLLW